jgi:polysaccharide chain length determinant protein (PEP-CTERM system associated)
MHEIFEQVITYLRGVWRNRWYALASAWLVCLVGWVVVYRLPDNYQATARVFVDTQSMLKPLLGGMAVLPNVDQQVQLMSKTLITRPNLEKVMRMADLDVRARTAGEQEQLIDSLAKRVELLSAGRDNVYFVKFNDRQPETAKKVVQSLITLFVESSLGDKRKDANMAKQFLDEQIKQYEETLVTSENSLKEFKQKNMGIMPGDDKDFYGRMTETAGQLSQARLELRELENARSAIKTQMAGEEPVLLPELESNESGGLEGYSNPELEARIQGLERNLDSLRVKFTEQHPDIISTKRVIAELKGQKEREAKEAGELARTREAEARTAAAGSERLPSSALLNQNPFFQQLKASLADAEAKAAGMRVRVQEYESRLEALKAMANQVPQVEADLKQLTRDYEINKKNYEELLARRQRAILSGDMESATGGLDFRIIDPPRVPSRPSDPNRPLLASLVLLGGLAGGALFALVLSQVRQTFHDRRSVRDVTGLPLLGSVSMIWTPGQKRVAGRAVAAFGATLIGLLVCYGLLMGYYLFQGQVA